MTHQAKNLWMQKIFEFFLIGHFILRSIRFDYKISEMIKIIFQCFVIMLWLSIHVAWVSETNEQADFKFFLRFYFLYSF